MLYSIKLRSASLFLCLVLLPLVAVHASAPAISGILTAPDTISVTGTVGATVSVYLLTTTTPTCNAAGIDAAGAALSFKVGGGAADTDFDLTASTTVFTLSTAAKNGDSLCLVASTKVGGTASYAAVAALAAAPPAEPPFVHSFYTAGAVISNQLSAANSTGAAQYIDIGFGFDWHTEGAKHSPGFNTNFSGRFSTVPVSAPVTNTSSTATASTPSSSATSTGTLNILSSQSSARIMGTIAIPFRISSSSSPNDALFLAFVSRGSFNTLINPSTTLTAPNGQSATVQFSPTYNDWSAGARIGWRSYNGSAANTKWQLDVTMGKYSNLQDDRCSAVVATAGASSAPTNTSCFQKVPAATTAPAGTQPTYETFALDRVSVPRLEVTGFARITSPFVIGIDANLSQYSLLTPTKLDLLNRSGSDVRIYFGITGTITDLFNKLGIGSSK